MWFDYELVQAGLLGFYTPKFRHLFSRAIHPLSFFQPIAITDTYIGTLFETSLSFELASPLLEVGGTVASASSLELDEALHSAC